MVVIVTLVSAIANKGILYSAGSLIIILLLILVPLTFFIRYKVKNKQWENIDASNKKERPSFYFTAIALIVILIIFLSIFSVFAFLIKGSISVLILLIFHAVLNKYLKASLHIAFAVFTSLVVYTFYPVIGYILFAVVPILIWARLKLKRHTPGEIAAGIATGTAAALVAIIF
jgi:hypothetical protein